jgi:thiosulfate reductase/polysulfide reductase chain A
MAAARPAVLVHPGRHVTWYGDDHQRLRAVAILSAVLGAWGRPGGYFLPGRLKLGRYECPERIAADQQFLMPEGAYPVVEEGVPSKVLVDAMLGGATRKVRGLMAYGQNVIASWPQPARTRQALAAADLVVVVDVLPTEPTLWADVVLPEAAYLERYDAPLAVRDAKQAYVALRQPLVAPPGEAWGPFAIARQLAHRLGEGGCLPCEDEQSMLAQVLAPLGVDPRQLALTGVHAMDPHDPYLADGADHRFATPTGKIEIYSRQLEEKGVAPLPSYRPHPEPPPGRFRLLYGRSPAHSFARSQNNPLLLEIDPVNRLWINDQVARELGVADGDAVEMVGEDGAASLPLPAKVTPGIRRDCVFTAHGFGGGSHLLGRAYGRGASDTELLTAATVDPDTGASAMHVAFVAVRRASRPAEWPAPLASRRKQREGAVR